MRVHFIGKAGSGKTTLMRATANALRVYEGPAFKVKKPKQNICAEFFGRVFWIGNGKILSDLGLAKSMLGFVRGRYLKRATFLLWLWSIFNERYRKSLLMKHKIVLVDQGLVHNLRKFCEPVPDCILRRLPLPNVVVFLETPGYLRLFRISGRNKRIKYKHLVYGERRIGQGVYMASNWLPYWSREETMHQLKMWNSKFCSPPMNADMIDEVILTADQKNKKQSSQTSKVVDNTGSKPWDWLPPALEEQGVHWIRIVNDNQTDLQDTAHNLAKKLFHLSMKSNK